MSKSAQYHFEQFLLSLGLSSEDEPELLQAPRRVAEFFGEFLEAGSKENTPQPSVFPCEHNSGIVAVSNLPYHSLCVHHFLPFFGEVHVLYEPSDHIIGFSGIASVVEHLSHRPTLQEYLTDQIHSRLQQIAQPTGLLVAVEARQLCMEMRGAHKSGNILTVRSSGTLSPLERTGGWHAYLNTVGSMK